MLSMMDISIDYGFQVGLTKIAESRQFSIKTALESIKTINFGDENPTLKNILKTD